MAKSKPDYDKEAMFRKIMPAPTFSGHERPAPDGDSSAASPVTQPREEPREPSLLQEGGVQVRKKSDPQLLVNVVEYAVIEKLDQAFSRFNCCKCDKCRKDAAAIALNGLKPKYVVAEESRMGAYTALINSTEVTNAVIKAIIQVRDKPRH